MNYRLLFNLATSIIASIIFFILVIVATFPLKNVKRASQRYFIAAVASAFMVSISYVVLYSIKNEESFLVVKNIVANYIFINIYLTVYFSSLYCFAYFKLPNRVFKIFIAISTTITVLFTDTMVVNAFTNIFFHIEINSANRMVMVRNNLFIIPYLQVWIINALILVAYSIKKGFTRVERIAFLVFTLFPSASLIFHIIFRNYSILTFAEVATFLFHFMFIYIQRGNMIQKQEAELSEQQIKLMISQIQPHFIYNCLSSISYLCTKDPMLASEAIDDFSDYLRVNFSNISQVKIVPFSKELEHTKKYLKLEKMRFEERVNVIYDIQVFDFNIPSLTLQPMVENAVKHGICKKTEGGTVIIKTSQTDKEYIIEVIDDGVGFDTTVEISDDQVHVGLKNVNDRLKSMMNGYIEAKSKINEGSHITIHIPK